jgi:predicted hydrocarbon binding protein
MIQKLGVEQTDQLFYDAGQSAGKAFYKNIMTEKRDFNKFIEQLQEKLKELKIGILRVEKADMDQLNFTLVVEEDLDCSGLPICGEEVCTYDEGFIHGLLTSFTNREFKVKEIDCWCSGDRVCRFDVKSVPV